MVQAIAAIGAASGSAAIGQTPGASPGASAGALQAQLQKCQNQLADWVDCPSGKTPQGQAKIQQIENQTAGIKAQLARIGTQKTQQPAAATAVPGASMAASSMSGVPASNTPTPGASVGGFINTYA